MKKKRIILIAVLIFAVVAAAVIAAGFAYSGAAEARAIEARVLESAPIDSSVAVSALPGCMNTEKNSYLSARTAANSRADIIELNIAFQADGTPVLAESFKEAEKAGVTLKQVFEYTAENKSLVFHLKLCELSDIPALCELIAEYSLQQRCFFVGVNTNNLKFIERQSGGEIMIFVDIEPPKNKNKEAEYYNNFNMAAQSGSLAGYRCKAEKLNGGIKDYLDMQSFPLCITGANSRSDIFKAIDFSISGFSIIISTEQPDVAIDSCDMVLRNS